LIEVDLSPTQFADLLTSMNVGDGVPCTIRHVACQRMAECPAVDQREVIEQEFKATTRRASDKASKLVGEVEDLMARSKMTKAEKERMRELLGFVHREVRDCLPFIQSQFNEAMEKTVTEAKGEVEAFISHKVASLGIEALRRQVEGGTVELFNGPERKALPDGEAEAKG
jgi:hypothetical protein